MGGLARFLVLAFGLVFLTQSPARAYVREVTDSGIPVFWRNPCITMHFYLGAPPPLLTADQYLAAATQAAALWSYPSLECTDIRLSIVAQAEAAADIGYDRKNVLVFRQDTWCRHPPPPQDAASPEAPCYSRSALAVTTIFRNGKTGELLDTDIEFNAVYYSWIDLVAHPEIANSMTADFQYALTHELGHVIGLDHTCYLAGHSAIRLKDDTGALEEDCKSPTLSSAAADSIMFPTVSQLDVTGVERKRVLTPDDARGACGIHPYVHDTCPSPEDGGCSLGAQGTLESGHPWRNALVALAGLACAFFALPRLRRRRS